MSNSEAETHFLNEEIKKLTQSLETLEQQYRQLRNDVNTIDQSASHGSADVPTDHMKPAVNYERRYNFIISGVPELPQGTPKVDRDKHNLDKIMELISELDSPISKSAIRDHLRLGPYKPKSIKIS